MDASSPTSSDRQAQERASATSTTKTIGSVIDLFCGVGGLAHGFMNEGFDIAAGIDIDEDCRFAFETNNGAPFFRRDLQDLRAGEIDELFCPGQPRILIGCAPCQPFSSYNQKNDDPNWKLLANFASLIVSCKPDVVSMENVARLLGFKGGSVFKEFVETLEVHGYRVTYKVVFTPNYGVPQQRTRLVLLASLHGDVELVETTHRPEKHRTVRDAIGFLPALDAGECDESDLLHCASRLSCLNLNRIRSSRPGGTWRDWDQSLVAACHKSASGKGYASVYGRMLWDAPSPTITTQFYGYGNGRFGHPSQDRAITLREGAMLQSFPSDYKFLRPGETVRVKSIGRQIGNAVPVVLAAAVARSISHHFEDL